MMMNLTKLVCAVVALAFVAIAVIAASGCTDPPSATRILAENGYTDINVTGYSWFACSKDDTYHTGFEAKSPNGTHVVGTVCAGMLFKNSTIRFE